MDYFAYTFFRSPAASAAKLPPLNDTENEPKTVKHYKEMTLYRSFRQKIHKLVKCSYTKLSKAHFNVGFFLISSHVLRMPT